MNFESTMRHQTVLDQAMEARELLILAFWPLVSEVEALVRIYEWELKPMEDTKVLELIDRYKDRMPTRAELLDAAEQILVSIDVERGTGKKSATEEAASLVQELHEKWTKTTLVF